MTSLNTPLTQHLIQQQHNDKQFENLSVEPDKTLTDNLTQDEFPPQNIPTTDSSTVHTVGSKPLVVPILVTEQKGPHPTQGSSILSTTNTDIKQLSLQPPKPPPRNFDPSPPPESGTFSNIYI